MISVAKFFAAYKKALDNLAEYYKNPIHDDPSQLSFPYIRVFKSLNTGLKINFRYIKQLYNKKLLFLIELDIVESKDLLNKLIIKFIRKYEHNAYFCLCKIRYNIKAIWI